MARQTGVLAGYEGEPSLLIIFAKAMMDVEREACVKVCDTLASDWHEKHHPLECARQIRARGQA
jgi:hypothetical protein